jgi:hypothetical protein
MQGELLPTETVTDIEIRVVGCTVVLAQFVIVSSTPLRNKGLPLNHGCGASEEDHLRN